MDAAYDHAYATFLNAGATLEVADVAATYVAIGLTYHAAAVAHLTNNGFNNAAALVAAAR